MEHLTTNVEQLKFSNGDQLIVMQHQFLLDAPPALLPLSLNHKFYLSIHLVVLMPWTT